MVKGSRNKVDKVASKSTSKGSANGNSSVPAAGKRKVSSELPSKRVEPSFPLESKNIRHPDDYFFESSDEDEKVVKIVSKKQAKVSASATPSNSNSKSGSKKKTNNKSLLKPVKTVELKPLTDEELQHRKPSYYDERWVGNEDDAGSVCSGVLDEDFCQICGESTLIPLAQTPSSSSSPCAPAAAAYTACADVLLCDVCDMEYHQRCLQLDNLPEAFVCARCEAERDYKQRHFDVRGVYKDAMVASGGKAAVNYSPAKPLAQAWREMQEKGLMLVSQLLDYQTMSHLMFGGIANTTRSGRAADSWRGAWSEFKDREKGGVYKGVVIDRNGRYELPLPQWVVKQLRLEEALQPVTARLQTLMQPAKGRVPSLRIHNVVYSPPHSPSQEWHYDFAPPSASSRGERYFTLLVHLNPLTSGEGGTEVWLEGGDWMKPKARTANASGGAENGAHTSNTNDASASASKGDGGSAADAACKASHKSKRKSPQAAEEYEGKGDLLRGRPGDCLVFGGALLHRGLGNQGPGPRFFYYAAFSDQKDLNAGQM